MSDAYTVGNEDGLPEHLNPVREAIARELYAQICLRNNVILQEDINGVAYAVTRMLDQLQAVRPEPAGTGAPARRASAGGFAADARLGAS